MSRCKHGWCEIEEAGTWRKFVFRCWKCRAIVELSLRPYGMHADIVEMPLAFVTPPEVSALVAEVLAMARQQAVTASARSAIGKRNRKLRKVA